MTVQDLPALNAALNATAALCLTAGFVFIRRKHVAAHRACMTAACLVSAAFLVSYVYYHAQTGARTPFGGTGLIRPVYHVMLLTHVVLAIAIAFLVPRTLYLALSGSFERHRAWARWTFPIWYYVSITGVLVYFSLYHWWPNTPR